LRAPRRDESWRVVEAGPPAATVLRGVAPPPEPPAPTLRIVDPMAGRDGPAPSMRIAPERIPMSRDVQLRSPLWTGMGLAVLVVAIVLVGMAALSHGNGQPASGLLGLLKLP
jgi:hypothetical protein